MNYPESRQILKKIKSSKRVLINCHPSVDLDSISSACSLKIVCESLGAKVEIISKDIIADEFLFVKGALEIKSEIDFKEWDYSSFDLFIVPDTQRWEFLEIKKPDIFVISLDHHPGNSISGEINILNTSSSSTSELLYELFMDMGIAIDEDLANALLPGILSDSGSLQQRNTTSKTLRIVADLMDCGGDLGKNIFETFYKNDFQLMKFWGEMITNSEIDTKHKFTWTAVSYETISKYKLFVSPTSTFTNLIFRKIKDTNFCIAMVEKEKGKLNISLRSRVSGFDVSNIADELGGGGHKEASGGQIVGLPFEDAVKKVLEIARKYSK